MEETYLQKRRRIMGRQFFCEYINQLKEILIPSISENNFVSIIDTDCIIARYKNKKLVQKNLIDITDKIKLVHIVISYLNAQTDPCYIWILRSYDCGLYKINSIMDLNWEHIKSVDTNDIITILSTNYEFELDFNDEADGRFIEISIYQTNPFLT